MKYIVASLKWVKDVFLDVFCGEKLQFAPIIISLSVSPWTANSPCASVHPLEVQVHPGWEALG